LACVSALPSLHRHFDLRVYVLGGPNSVLLEGLGDEIIGRMKFYRFNVYSMLFMLPVIVGSLWAFKPDIVISSLWRSAVVGWLYKRFRRRVTYSLLMHSSEFFHRADRFFTTRAM